MVHGVWTHNTIFQLALVSTAGGQQVVNVHNFEASGALQLLLTGDGPKLAAAAEVINRWQSNCQTSYLACLSNEQFLERFSCQIIEQPSQYEGRMSNVEESYTAPTGQGTHIQQLGDLDSAACIRWRTPGSGKSRRGRTYLGPVPDTMIQDGLLNGGYRALVQAYATAMLTAFGPATVLSDPMHLTIYSKPYDTGDYQYVRRETSGLVIVTPPDYAGNSTNVTAHNVDTVARVQRRREVGVGS